MLDQGPSNPGDNPIILRSNNSVYWVFLFFAAVFAFALVRGYLGAATTAGRIGTIIFMGVPTCLFIWIALWVATHRATMSISAGAITYTRSATARTKAAGGPPTLVLDRSSGSDLTVVTATRNGRKRPGVVGLTIRGSGMTVPLVTFDANAVRHACLAKGWQFPV